jgi:xanthine dehydrogenase YagS FAD-binding subunit
MHPFTLSTVDDPAAAIAAHARDPELAFIAGGTDLIGLMKDHVALPERLLDINRLPNMARIEAVPDGGLRIGALTRMSDAAGCSARHGLNSNHAIFGWSESCVATNPSDVAVALAALDATIVVRGTAGERAIPSTDFHPLPGDAPERDNALGRGDLILSIEVPACAEGRASHYLKIRDRQSYEFALVSAAAAVATDGRSIRSARLALGGVAHKPWRLRAAETALRGASLDDIDTLRAAIARSFTEARPLAQNAFKIDLAQRVALRALQTAGARA